MKIKSKDTNIWFTSDSHYGHRNICLGASDWIDAMMSCRDFPTVEEMNDEILYQINRNVGEDDILFHLGDWSFGGIENIWNFRKRINCKNIHFILGNHDHHIIKDKELPNVLYDFDDRKYVNGDPQKDGFIQYKSFYDYSNIVKAQDIFSSIQHYLEVDIDGVLVMLFHRPIEDFHNNERRDVIHLHGHCHGNLNHDLPNRLDVGIDNIFKIFGEYRPINWKEILTLT